MDRDCRGDGRGLSLGMGDRLGGRYMWDYSIFAAIVYNIPL